MQSIAAALQCPLDALIGGDVKSGLVPLITEPTLKVIGVAETGSFRKRGDMGAAFIDKIGGPVHPRYPDAQHYVLEMRDYSMDRAPAPIPFGALVMCLDIADARLQIEPQNIYAVVRRHDKHQELMIRRAVLNSGGIILRAESSRPDKYPDIEVATLTSDPAAKVYAIGLVYGAFTYFSR